MKIFLHTADIDKIFRQGKIKEVIIFQEDFEKKYKKDGKAAVQIIADASDPNNAEILTNYTTAIINDFQREQMAENKIPYQIVPEVQMRYNPDLKSVFMFVPGIISILLMLVCAMMTSISIAREKELGTMEILLVSPLKPLQIIVGKVIPYVFLSIINAVTIILLGQMGVWDAYYRQLPDAIVCNHCFYHHGFITRYFYFHYCQ